MADQLRPAPCLHHRKKQLAWKAPLLPSVDMEQLPHQHNTKKSLSGSYPITHAHTHLGWLCWCCVAVAFRLPGSDLLMGLPVVLDTNNENVREGQRVRVALYYA
jgi:hypothetical protein